MAANNTPHAPSKAGRASRKVSPWSRGPACETKAAKASFMRYTKRGKANPTRARLEE